MKLVKMKNKQLSKLIKPTNDHFYGRKHERAYILKLQNFNLIRNIIVFNNHSDTI